MIFYLPDAPRALRVHLYVCVYICMCVCTCKRDMLDTRNTRDPLPLCMCVCVYVFECMEQICFCMSVCVFECVKEMKVNLILRSILKVSRALRMGGAGGAGAGADGAMPLLNCVQGAAMSLCEQGAREATAPGPPGAGPASSPWEASKPAGPPCDVSELFCDVSKHPQGPVDPNCGRGGGGDVGGGGGGSFGGAGGL
jgi:hypothetical protein